MSDDDDLDFALERLKQMRRDLSLDNPESLYSIGSMTYDGDGVPQDYIEAACWFRMAAEEGHAKAQHNLALMYEHGAGLPENFTEAAKWYRMAAEQGHSGSQNNLGILFETGKGVVQDYVEAASWYRKAAANGDANAVANIKRIEVIQKRNNYTEMVSDFTEGVENLTPLIGDCALLPHPKTDLLYAVRWLIADYDEPLKEVSNPAFQERIESLQSTLCDLFTRLARDWHEIEATDKEAVSRLSQMITFPDWALPLKDKYINEDKAREEAADTAFRVLVDRVHDE